MNALGYLLIVAGVFVAWSLFKGVNPITEIKKMITGK